MEVTCPSCGAVFGLDPSMGEDQVCPACMFPFQLEGDGGGGLPGAMELDVQGEDGQLLGRLDRISIRERIYNGELKGGERVRLDGADWEPIGNRPEFAQVLALVGVDVAGLAVARQQIKGWKRDQSAGGNKAAPRQQVLPRTDKPGTRIEIPSPAAEMDPRTKKLAMVLVALGVLWVFDFFMTSI